MERKTAFVTGAGGGLGLACSRYLSAHGYVVYAGDIRTDGIVALKDPNIIPVVLDVSDTKKVQDAYTEVSAKVDHLDAVINFAGIMAMGSLVETDPSVMERMININFLGMYRVNKIFFPLLEKTKGRIVDISSECGIFSPSTFNGFYGTTKYAVEAYSGALRRELMFLGIKVIKIRPGAFSTNMQGSTKKQFDKMLAGTTHYKAIMEKMGVLMEKDAGKPADPSVLAKTIYHALTVKKPKISYNVNIAKNMKMMDMFSPSMQDRLYYRTFR